MRFSTITVVPSCTTPGTTPDITTVIRMGRIAMRSHRAAVIRSRGPSAALCSRVSIHAEYRESIGTQQGAFFQPNLSRSVNGRSAEGSQIFFRTTAEQSAADFQLADRMPRKQSETRRVWPPEREKEPGIPARPSTEPMPKRVTTIVSPDFFAVFGPF